jgi:thioredoxin-like negative regulator of GroEL
MAIDVSRTGLPAPAPRPVVSDPRRWHARVSARILRAGAWVLVLALLGRNAWWAWREVRPIADLPTLNRWIGQGRDREAEWALRERLRRSPHDGEALSLLARILAARGDSLGCAQTLHQVPFWWPTKGTMLFLEGQAFKRIDRMSDAEAAWTELTAMDPLHPMPDALVSKAVLELLELYALEQRWDEARRLLWRAFDDAEPADRPALLILRVRTELERIPPSTAVVKLRRFAAAVPEDWEARRALALAEQAIGNPHEAIRNLARCLDERRADPRGWREYLSILYERGDQDGLREALARVPAAAADDPEIQKHRAKLFETHADWARAAAAYRGMVEIEPFNAEYLYRLAAAEERLGQRDQAREHRDQSRMIRAARADLAAAFQTYLDTSKAAPPAPHDLAAAVQRLASIAEVLGWERDAEAWSQLAPAD